MRRGRTGARAGRGASQGGFTLVEVLLTLLIMAGILVSITQILTAARQTRDTIHNVQESQLAGPAILDRIERDLRGLFVLNRHATLSLRIQNRVLSGYDADTLDFVTTVDSLVPYRENTGQDFRRADVNEVGYRLRPHPRNDDFLEIYRREDFGIDDEPFEGGSFSFLHDRVKGFDVQVYDEDGPDAEPLESWNADDGFSGLPAWIEVHLTIELAPRLVREQLIVDRRTLTYKRLYRFPEILRRSIESQVLLTVPDPSLAPAGTPQGGPAAGGPGGDGGDGGGDGGGGGPPGGGDGGGVNPFEEN